MEINEFLNIFLFLILRFAKMYRQTIMFLFAMQNGFKVETILKIMSRNNLISGFEM